MERWRVWESERLSDENPKASRLRPQKRRLKWGDSMADVDLGGAREDAGEEMEREIEECILR